MCGKNYVLFHSCFKQVTETVSMSKHEIVFLIALRLLNEPMCTPLNKLYIMSDICRMGINGVKVRHQTSPL